MKTHIMIIDDSHEKLFATKCLLSAKYRLSMKSVVAQTPTEVHQLVEAGVDCLWVKPKGSILELDQICSKRGANCRNTRVTVVLAEDLTEKDFTTLMARASLARKSRGAQESEILAA